ncbi:hypothetical protein HY570_03105 [Candidatus Micrarchaeota archaeon]|nr:hypothetical protein [Candidatus Micrarchaeota archaeon]
MEIGFLAAFVITNLVEMLVAYFILGKDEKISLILPVVFCCNLVTMPWVWFIFPFFLHLPYLQTLLISELFAFIVEIVIYIEAFKNSTRDSSIMAASIGNLTSFILGLLVALL